MLLAYLLFFFDLGNSQDRLSEQTYFIPPTKEKDTSSNTESKVENVVSATETPYDEVELPKEPYVSPVDFDALWEVNTDVCAWLDIPGTEISYPILQHPEDDGWYLKRNLQGQSDSNGVLFTEASYNSTDFSDPLTIVYGHRADSGTIFGTLQKEYSSQDRLTEHSEIVVYLPDRELHFEVFAAVPYDNRHILYNYDFSDKRTFRLFFNEILSIRAMEAVFAENAAVQSDEQTLLLSTCLIGNRSKRFLVCGKLSEIIS